MLAVSASGRVATRVLDTIPWYIVPADDKDNARLIVSHVVIDTLEGLKMAYPVVGPARKRELHAIRKVLVNQGR